MERASSLFREAGDATLGTQLPSHGAVLMRYHSAPSSVLASLLQSEDVLTNALPHMEDTELVEMCMLNAPANAHNATLNTQAEYTTVQSPHMLDSLSSTVPQVPNASSSCPLQQCTDPNAAGQLRSIFQQRQITAVDNLQPSTQNARNHRGVTKSTYLGLAASVPPLIQPFVSAEGNLIRQSSFPAEILSRLGIEDGNEASIQGFAGNLTRRANMMAFSTVAESVHLDDGRLTGMEVDIGNDNMRTAHLRPNGTWDAHVPPCNGGNTRFPVKNTGLFESTEPGLMKGSSFNCKSSSDHVNGETMVGVCKNRSMESSLSINQSSLFRQSSLPASLLSQLSFDGASEKVSMTSSSGNSSEDGGPHFTSQVSGLWDEAGGPFGQRKRVRKVEDKAANKFCTLDSIQGISVENELLHWKVGGQVGASSSGHLLSTDDSVLCKVRAKRGCATHPRSIAERVRRTKISEAMRKLQELVPNMEKQTNTATMLEEAVNYVKFLKQQVQKLSENQSKCRGTCDAMNNR